jgi:hypothetical protein
MAQTKSPAKKSPAKKSKARPGSSASGSKAKSSSRPKASRSRSKASPSSSRASSRNGASKVVPDGLKSALDAVEDAGQKAGKATGKAASKAKVPLIAGGAALVGAASGMALNAARSNSSKVLGVKMPKTKVKIRSKDLAKAADRIAGAGEQIGRLSTGIREIQGSGHADNGNGQHRSPIEVLVQGLTRRR